MKTLLSNPRTGGVMLASVAAWLLLGWLWGDDWPWTVLRAFGATLTIVGISALFTSNTAIARVSRVALRPLLGGWCAYILGGDSDVVLVTAALFAALLIGIEHVIQRELRRRQAGDLSVPASFASRRSGSSRRR